MLDEIRLGCVRLEEVVFGEIRLFIFENKFWKSLIEVMWELEDYVRCDQAVNKVMAMVSLLSMLIFVYPDEGCVLFVLGYYSFQQKQLITILQDRFVLQLI